MHNYSGLIGIHGIQHHCELSWLLVSSLQCWDSCLSLHFDATITLTKTIFGEKRIYPSHISPITVHHWGRLVQELQTGTGRKNWRTANRGWLFTGLFLWLPQFPFSYSPGPPSLEHDTSHSELGLPTAISNHKNSLYADLMEASPQVRFPPARWLVCSRWQRLTWVTGKDRSPSLWPWNHIRFFSLWETPFDWTQTYSNDFLLIQVRRKEKDAKEGVN